MIDPRIRLDFIVKALRHGDEVVTRESLRLQFRYETGEDPTPEDLDWAIRKLARDEEKR